MNLMPGILFRYIFRQAAGSVAMIMASLTGVVWIALALKQLNLVTSQGQDTWMFIQMTLLALPNLMALIAPIALLVATIHVLNRLNGDSELIVGTDAGVDLALSDERVSGRHLSIRAHDGRRGSLPSG